jgi:hypothetical protein
LRLERTPCFGENILTVARCFDSGLFSYAILFTHERQRDGLLKSHRFETVAFLG